MKRIEDLSLLWKHKDFKAALALVDDMLTEEHECPYLLTKRGMLILLQQDDTGPSLEEAEKCFLRAHTLAPNNLDTIEELAHFYGAVIPLPDKARHYSGLFEDRVRISLEQMREIVD